VANLGSMRGIIGRLDNWIERRPWPIAVCAGVLMGVLLTTIELVLDDSPDWLFVILLTLAFTLMIGFKGQAQRRQRRQS
jgi:hypothetical protein